MSQKFTTCSVNLVARVTLIPFQGMRKKKTLEARLLQCIHNLVPRVLELLDQQVVVRRDSGMVKNYL